MFCVICEGLRGCPEKSVFRAADVARLAHELGVEQIEAAAPPVPSEGSLPGDATLPQGVPGTVRPKRRDPIKLIGTRLSMDSRWAEISDLDIETWLDSIEAVQFDRVRRVAALTIERLNRVVAAIEADPRSRQPASEVNDAGEFLEPAARSNPDA